MTGSLGFEASHNCIHEYYTCIYFWWVSGRLNWLKWCPMDFSITPQQVIGWQELTDANKGATDPFLLSVPEFIAFCSVHWVSLWHFWKYALQLSHEFRCDDQCKLHLFSVFICSLFKEEKFFYLVKQVVRQRGRQKNQKHSRFIFFRFCMAQSVQGG